MRETDGFSNLTELVFNGAGAVNPFDQYGHFIRGLLPTNNCVDYDVVPGELQRELRRRDHHRGGRPRA